MINLLRRIQVCQVEHGPSGIATFHFVGSGKNKIVIFRAASYKTTQQRFLVFSESRCPSKNLIQSVLRPDLYFNLLKLIISYLTRSITRQY